MANQVLYGFTALKDLFSQRVTTAGVEVISRAIQATVDEHNRQMSALLSLFAQPTTDHQKRYKTPTNARLQPGDEFGRARPIKPQGYYDVGFPLQMGLAAWGTDFIAREKMTVAEANEATATLISADARWMRDHILAALYQENSWTFTDDEFGSITVKGPASGDTDKYLIIAGADSAQTDDHMLAQLAAIADGANPFPTIHDELKEHPENGGEVIVFTPTNLRASIEGLTGFKEPGDANVRVGNANDVLVGRLNVPVPGEVIGYVDKCWVVEWRAMPNDYLIGVTSAGEPPLGMRLDPEASLQGFRRVAERNDHPLYESQWMRRAGFGAWNRAGAVTYRIGNATYAAPTGYTNPMP